MDIKRLVVILCIPRYKKRSGNFEYSPLCPLFSSLIRSMRLNNEDSKETSSKFNFNSNNFNSSKFNFLIYLQ